MYRTARQTILLVEANASLRRVIALGLQSRDLRVIEAAAVADISDLQAQQPSLVVVDIDGEVGNSHELLAEIGAHPRLARLPLITLAWDTSLRVNGQADNLDNLADLDDRLIRLAKPFDARALQNAIESMLASGERILQLAANSSPITRTTPPAPSICPMITAAGLMLAFVGLMLQLAVTAVGLVIVVVALLCWSLGPRESQRESVLSPG